jgi:hypothetical protein
MAYCDECDWIEVLTVEGPDNGAAHCQRCGETQRFVLPMAITVYCAALNAFEKAHAHCQSRESENRSFGNKGTDDAD